MQKKFLLIASFADSIMVFRGDFIESLTRAGCCVHVAAPSISDNADLRRYFAGNGIHWHDLFLSRTGLNPVQDVRTLLALAWLMLRIRPDYVMGYTIKPVIYGLIASSLSRVPHRFALITGLGHTFQAERRRSLLQRLVSALYRISLSRAEKVLFQNPDDESLFRTLGILPDHVPSKVVNGSGVDVNRYTVVPLPAVPLRFLLIARLIGAKGIREYAQAAAIIRQHHSNVRFDLVGWRDDNPDSISQAELDRWTGSGLINYLGRLGDVRPAIANASVYVLPSYYREGVPRTVLEAMAMGRPIITTNSPGCRETVVNGDNGYVVPVKDAKALARAMLRFVECPEMVGVMGKRSREMAEDKYDVRKVNEVMLKELRIG